MKILEAIVLAEVEWHDSFIAAIQDCVEQLKVGDQSRLDGRTAKEVLQFILEALQSVKTGREVHPCEVP